MDERVERINGLACNIIEAGADTSQMKHQTAANMTALGEKMGFFDLSLLPQRVHTAFLDAVATGVVLIGGPSIAPEVARSMFLVALTITKLYEGEIVPQKGE